jgi:hypothetical protein
MAIYTHDAALDAALDIINTGTRIDITVTQATTFGNATTKDTHSLGYKTGLTVGNPEDGDVDGRKVVVPAITDGTVDCTGTQTAGFWALTDGATLYATGPLTATQDVTDGNTFSLDAIDITLRDFTAP